MNPNPYNTLTGIKLARYRHFARRMHERVKPKVKARDAWHLINEAIAAGDDTHVRFRARLSRSGRRLWRVQMGSTVFFAIYDHEAGCPVTVLGPDMRVPREGRAAINLAGME